jgi:hypothetical protein
MEKMASFRSHKADPAARAELSGNDLFGSTVAAVARSALIQKLVLLPKMKAAAFFQPEDHVAWKKVHESVRPSTPLGVYRVNAVQMGAVFTSGVVRQR